MWKEIINNAINGVIEWILFVFSIAVPIYISFFPSNIDKLDNKSLILLVIILTTIVIFLVKLLWTTINIVQKNRINLPRLKSVKGDKYIFEESKLFDANSYVSVYYIDEEQEKLALGYVESIISNTQKLQVKLIENISQEIMDKINNYRNKIFIKPTLTTNEIDVNLIKTGDNNE